MALPKERPGLRANAVLHEATARPVTDAPMRPVRSITRAAGPLDKMAPLRGTGPIGSAYLLSGGTAV